MNQESNGMNRDSVTRRDFVRTSSAAVAGGVVTSGLSLAKGAHAAGDDVLRVGVIGCGGRGRGAVADICNADKLLAEAGGSASGRVEIVAAADAFRGQLDRCLRRLERDHPERIKVSDDSKFHGLDGYRGVLQSGCDIVILATPPGFRPLHFESAIEAGKHVFMEKPVAVDAPGIRRVLEAGERATEKALTVGVGLQRRHDPKYLEAIRRLHAGEIGEIHLTKVYWNSAGVWVRSRADFARSFGHDPSELEYQVYNWYYFNWLCGDHIVEQHIHNLDVSNWATGMRPASANGMGGRAVRYGRDHGQIFDHHMVEYTYPNGATMLSQARHQPGCWTAVHEDIHGARGVAELGSGRPCSISIDGTTSAYDGPKTDAYLQEHVDLLTAIRTGNSYNETEHGAEATMTAILGRMATYSGKVVTWEQAIASEASLTAGDPVSWNDTPPVTPDSNGLYPLPVPGEA